MAKYYESKDGLRISIVANTTFMYKLKGIFVGGTTRTSSELENSLSKSCKELSKKEFEKDMPRNGEVNAKFIQQYASCVATEEIDN